ncbi:hypothetical protein IFM89_033700 [Coptis chinensis]|uniref:Uncharacterized protein n=1 Tax=Coptis chinensis TaxID=261450 RepID=A0A835LKM1_9MAGN|nr:hypothetical protein IFM89_033700 [Coptis chinensis]
MSSRIFALDITSDGGFQRHNAGTSTTFNWCSKSKGKGKGYAVVGGFGNGTKTWNVRDNTKFNRVLHSMRDMRQTIAVGVIKSVEKKDPSGAKVTKSAAKKK